MKNKKMRKYIQKHPFPLEIIIGFFLIVMVLIGVAKMDMLSTQRNLYVTTNYIKEQCNRFAKINLAAETKSLMRIIESSKQVSHMLMEKKGACERKDLEQYAKVSYLSGVVLLDEKGKVVSEYHEEGKTPKELKEAMKSTALLDTFAYKKKRYAARIDRKDGSQIDIAASSRLDQKGVVVVYYHTPLEYIESFDLSIASLLSGYDMNNDGTIVVSKGNTIIASNNPSLEGKKTKTIPILDKTLNSSKADQLVHASEKTKSLKKYFGLMSRGRDFYVFTYLPERSVFKNTPLVLFYTIVIYLILIGIIHVMRWKIREESQKEYTKRLQEKNIELGIAVKHADSANEAKSNFLSRMSHDIRTPLNGIIGLLEISEAHFDNNKMIQENHRKMRIAADHLLSLINDVLQMSKLESGEIIIAHEILDLQRLSQDILVIVSQKAAEFSVVMECDRDSDEIEYNWVYGSPLHLRQIFLNIYTNCIKYNIVGGKISTLVKCIEKKETSVTYCWRIKDTGIGMSEEFLARIFDPFTQASSDARSVYQGTGLGMTIVKGLIEQMNGTIEIHSKKGEGSEFIITLPFEIAKKPEESLEKPAQMVENLKHLSILMAEDNELNAEIAQTLLVDAGAKVTLANNGKEALQAFKEGEAGTFDVILMDVMMPEMDGLTASKKIRALEREDAKIIPIIAMTANAFKEDADQCLAAGMNAHLAKPLDIEKVKQTISEQVKKVRKISHYIS